MNESKKVGRPNKGLKHLVGLMLTKEMKDDLNKRAKSKNVSPSEYIRELIRRD